MRLHENNFDMKKVLLFALMMCLPVIGHAQTKGAQDRLDSIYTEVKDIAQQLAKQYVDGVFSNTYKLYKTENIYIFLRLNTSNGKIDQVQWNLDRDKELITVLNDVDLTYGISIGNHNGRFELYPTQNMYQFLLLDKNFGSMWHVQWGLDSKKRWIVPIN